MARGPAVLVVDDDPAIRRLLRRSLTAAGFRVQDMEPGRGALGRFAERPFDLLILDIDPPAGGGPEIVRNMRALSPIPILALSARGDEKTAVDALENGADDYVRKPFNLGELLARINNALRRRAREQGKPAQIVSGDLEIDLLHRRVRSHGRDVQLSGKPYEVLRVLAEGAGKALTYQEILSAVWGARHLDRRQSLRVAIRVLRRKLEADPARPRHIRTEVGVGYRLETRMNSARHGPCCGTQADDRPTET